MTSDEVEKSIWCLVANIRKEIPYGPAGEETKIGVKKFRGGAKVYIIDWFPGMCESIVVVGQHRDSRKFIKCIIRAKAVENLRAKLVYSPKIIEIAENHVENDHGSPITEEHIKNMANVLPSWWTM